MTGKKYFTAVCGIKNSGKTTLLEKIVRTLTERGFRVAVIKHDGHDFECDLPGTDSRRFTEAGAIGVSVYSKSQLFIRKKREMPGLGNSSAERKLSCEENVPAEGELSAKTQACGEKPELHVGEPGAAAATPGTCDGEQGTNNAGHGGCADAREIHERKSDPRSGRYEHELLSSLAQSFSEADVLLVEGCKEYPFRKIEVVRSAVSKRPVSNPAGRFLVVSDLKEEETGERTLPFGELEKIADAILETESVNGFAGDIGRTSRITGPKSEYSEVHDGLSFANAVQSGVLNCCAVLLRGGKSRRMGTDKAMLIWEGNTFLRNVADQMDFFEEKYLSAAAEPEKASAGSCLQDAGGHDRSVLRPERNTVSGHEKPGAVPQPSDGLTGDWIVLPDKIPDCGPLGGIWTALSTCRAEWALAASCDIPAVRRSLFFKLLKSRSEDVDIVCPVTPDGRMHMTCALYRRTAAPMLEAQLREGNNRMRGLFTSCRVKTIPVRDAEEVRMLSNINTAEELERVRRE